MKTRNASTDCLSKAASFVIESLESRQLMASISINFQPSSSAIPGGMIADTGATYASRNGYTYGWESNISANTVQRTTSYTSYQRYKTFIQTQNNGDHKWEIALSSGKYAISAAGGDPSEFNSKINFTAEGTTLLFGTTTSSSRFIKGAKTIDVTDGKLTITNGSGAVNNKLLWIIIERVGDASGGGGSGGDGASISGIVFNDNNKNGKLDSGESTASGRTVFLDLNGNNIHDVGERSTQSNASGLYQFSNLDEGTYFVRRNFPAGYTYSTNPLNITLADGQAVTGANIGSTTGTTVPPDDDDDHDHDHIAPSNFEWRDAPHSDVGHTEPQTVTLGSKVYIFSGYQTKYLPGSRVDVFDMKTKTWSRKKDMPLPFTHSATALVGTDVWFAGGYITKPGSTTSQQTYLKDVWRYNSINDTWHKEGELPDWRSSSGMVYYKNKLYLFSGDDKARLNPVTTTWVLDLNNRAAGWKTLAPIPKGRSHFGIVELDGFVYIIGGQKLIDAESVHYADCWRYDIANNSWKQIANYPTVLSHVSPSSFAYHKRIIVAGGETSFNHSINNVREYNPATNTWRNLASLPGDRAAGVASFYGTQLFFTGGKLGGTIKTDTWWAEIGL